MFDRSSTFGEALDSPAARSVLEVFLPGIAASPMATQFRGARLGQLVNLVPGLAEDGRQGPVLWQALAEVDEGGAGRAPYAPAIDPRPDYEADDVRGPRPRSPFPARPAVGRASRCASRGRATATRSSTSSSTRILHERRARRCASAGSTTATAMYLIRLLAETDRRLGVRDALDGPLARRHRRARSSCRAGAGLARSGARRRLPLRARRRHAAPPARHHRVRVDAPARGAPGADAAHPRAAPASPRCACASSRSRTSTTRTSRTTSPSPARSRTGFDLERFDPAHFRRLEERIAQLGELGIEADLILFHAYDRWGFADLGPAVDERYLRYVVRRLAAYANVWWSMANEYDLLWAKTEDGLGAARRRSSARRTRTGT